MVTNDTSLVLNQRLSHFRFGSNLGEQAVTNICLQTKYQLMWHTYLCLMPLSWNVINVSNSNNKCMFSFVFVISFTQTHADCLPWHDAGLLHGSQNKITKSLPQLCLTILPWWLSDSNNWNECPYWKCQHIEHDVRINLQLYWQ